jgi:hypothetical protein
MFKIPAAACFFYGHCGGSFSGSRLFYPIFFFLQVLGNKNVSTLFFPAMKCFFNHFFGNHYSALPFYFV